jgi:hypothetical protein
LFGFSKETEQLVAQPRELASFSQIDPPLFFQLVFFASPSETGVMRV